MADVSQDQNTANSSPQGSAPQGNGQAVFNYFVSQGLPPHQAAGIVGNLQGESGQLINPSAIDRGDGSDGSDSIGIGQWNGDRANALKAYAASQGTPWNDLNTQMQFLHSELRGPESAAYSKLLAAQSPEEASQAMLGYERPKDWNVPGAHSDRARYAAQAYSAYTGVPYTGSAPSTGILNQSASAGSSGKPGVLNGGTSDAPESDDAALTNFLAKAAPPVEQGPAPYMPQISFASPKGFDKAKFMAALKRKIA
jgi:hypothetical protein